MNDLAWVLPLRTNEFTTFFKIFPLFASETFYLVTISIGCWCWKREFFKNLAMIVCLSTLFNTALKAFFQIPRPSIEHLVTALDPLGFPSGDVQVVTTVWLTLSWYFKSIYLWIFSFLLIFFVGLSRVYLGVHSPLDVLGGISAGFLIFLVYLYIQKSNTTFEINSLFIMFALVFLGIYFLNSQDLNALHTSSIKSIGTLLGIMIGDKLYRKFNIMNDVVTNKSNIYLQIITAILGLSTLWLLRKGLSFSWQVEPHSLYIFISYIIIGTHFIFIVPFSVHFLRTHRIERGNMLKRYPKSRFAPKLDPN